MRRACWSGIALVLLVSLSACSGPGALSSDEAAIEQRLRREARTWEGTPHRLGGVTRRGADCSGLVLTVYRDLFGIDLPRTTVEQARAGQSVARSRLRPGDLVFFRTSPKSRHVGIYLLDGDFFHVSSSRGATISHLSEPYWHERYWTARRVLPPGSSKHSAPTSAPPPHTPPVPPQRTGW